MQVKKASLHCSYSAPVLVSLTVCGAVVARGVTFFVVAVAFRDIGTRVEMVFFVDLGVKMDADFVSREETVVFTALRDVVFLVVFSVVIFPRDVTFVLRDEASALNMQTAEIIIKQRIFFISWLILANFQNVEQAKSRNFI